MPRPVITLANGWRWAVKASCWRKNEPVLETMIIPSRMDKRFFSWPISPASPGQGSGQRWLASPCGRSHRREGCPARLSLPVVPCPPAAHSISSSSRCRTLPSAITTPREQTSTARWGMSALPIHPFRDERCSRFGIGKGEGWLQRQKSLQRQGQTQHQHHEANQTQR